MYVSQYQNDKTLTIVINRHESLNAIGPTIAKELLACLSNLASNLKQNQTTVNCLCLRASSVKVRDKSIWIAGGDIKELLTLKKTEAKAFFKTMNRVCVLIETLPIPVLAAVDGSAIGGAAELALACDWRIGTKLASFDFKQLAIGLPTGFGGGARLIGICGLAQTQKILYTKKLVKARRAYKLGLLHELIEKPDDFDMAVDARLKQLSEISPEAFAAQKSILLSGQITAEARQNNMESTIATFMSAWANPSHREFMTNFSKRGT